MAIVELQRKLRTCTPGNERAVVDELLASWEREQLAARGRGVAWSAYRDGGVAELRSLGDELD